MKKLLFVLSALIVVCSCAGDKDDVLHGIHFQEITETCTLNLSDLGSDFKAVRLETGPDILLDARTKYYIGNKNIICCTRTKLLQFSAGGTFIRTLAYEGKGPDEFDMIVDGAFNSDESLFFYYDYYDNGISVINLESGQREDKILLAKSSSAKTFSLVKDNMFAIMNHKSEASDYMIYYQDMASQVTGGVLVPENLPTLPIGETNQMVGSKNGLIYLNTAVGGDTIYSIEGNDALNLFYLDVGQKIDYVKTLDGFFANIVLLSGDIFVFRNIAWGMRSENGFDRVRFTGTRLYKSDSQGHNAREITVFNNDLFGQEYLDDKLYDIFEDIFVNYNFGILALKFDALDLIKMHNEGVEFNDLDIDIDGMSEADNPLLLVGKLK